MNNDDVEYFSDIGSFFISLQTHNYVKLFQELADSLFDNWREVFMDYPFPSYN